MLLTFSKDSFVDAIKAGRKIHTIREDKNKRWKVGMKIHFWRGNPRNTNSKNKPYPFMLPGEMTVVKRIDEIRIEKAPDDHVLPFIYLNGKMILMIETISLIYADGFNTFEEFNAWFFPDGKTEFKGRLIHWTDCDYGKYL